MRKDYMECPYCKGKGRVYKHYLKAYVVCVPCDGSGETPKIGDETFRAFRRRLHG